MPRSIFLVSLATLCLAAPKPWANDTTLCTIAERIAGQQVVPLAGIAALDASVTAFLSLVVGPPWNRSFSDIDYATNTAAFWPAMNHTVRTRAIITAVVSPGSQYFGQNDTAAVALSLLDWWLVRDLQSVNWWFNGIGVGGYVGPTALLLWDALSSNESAAATAVVGRSSYKGMTGANLVWEAGNVLMAGLFEGNRTTVAGAAAASFTVIAFAPGALEGMKADGAFFQHGAQLYNGGYGQSFCYDSEHFYRVCCLCHRDLLSLLSQSSTFLRWSRIHPLRRRLLRGTPSRAGLSTARYA